MPTQRARPVVLVASLLFVAATVGGCRTMSDVVQAKEAGEGTTKLHDVDCDTAYTFGAQVFRDEGADSVEEHRSERYMLSSAGYNVISVGTVMGAWFVPEKTGKCAVTVVTKRKYATDLVTRLTEGTFHDRLADYVAERNSEKNKKKTIVPASAPAPAPAPGAETASKPATDTKATPAKKPAKKKSPAKKAPAKKPADDKAKTDKAKNGAANASKDAAAAK